MLYIIYVLLLSDLLAGTTTTVDKTTKVPVECELKLGENLMNPNVQFGINFPSLDVQMRSLMQSFFFQSGRD